VPKPFSPSELAARVEDLLSDQPDESFLMRKRIVIVDDQPDLRKLVGLTLGHCDYDIVEAGSGTEALEAIRRNPPHAVVLDLMMPGELNGHDVCHAIKADEKLTAVPVLILTACDGNADRAEADRRGADDFMVKPFSPLDLIARVERLVSTRVPGDAR
jgi:DNA-binding response OmpR family regulator